MDLYIRKILRVSVAQICQTIGYNSIQSIPLELLIDSLHKFLQEFARDLHRHVELFNRTEANLDDVALSLESLNIKVADLLEYINHVQPVGCSVDIPELPAAKSSNLNFLKPGSKEVLTRPVHIYEHLPPILRDTADVDDKSNIAIISPNPCNVNTAGSYNGNINDHGEDVKLAPQNQSELNDGCSNSGIVVVDNSSTNQSVDIKRKPALDTTLALPSSATREISSVMMTSGGFISPAIEGRMPECLIPDVVEKYFGLDAPVAPTAPIAVATPMPAPSGKKTTSSQSPTSNPSQSSASIRASNKNEHTNAATTGLKTSQAVEKKLLKKVKKKSISAMQPPNISGIAPPVLNDKAQRKRIKMLQKSMAKNTANGSNAAYKAKNVNAMTQAAQEKYLKKQYKLKQKQMRQQLVQKHMEVALSSSGNLLNNIKGQSGNAAGEISSSSGKPKKDCFVVPPTPMPEELPATESKNSNSFLQPLLFPSSKGLYNHSLSGSQDAQGNSPTKQITPSPKYDEVKLSNEPDRSKLNIFKKISSSQRKERADLSTTASSTNPTVSNTSIQLSSNTDAAPGGSSSNTTIFGDDQVISLPSGTTITPAPPSGSGRHVYAPPPSKASTDFDSVISVDDDGSIPDSSVVLMQRGDLMIHKPKKRGRKPGSKNQPKVVGLNTKKAKKLKKSFFGHHSNSNLMEPLNLSHSSIANIANIPLGIASTFPIESDSVSKLKKDRKKVKMRKDTNFIRNTGKAASSRNLAPTKEEFASINQKLMMMDTVLQAAPPLPTRIHSPMSSRTGRSSSPAANSFVMDPDHPIKVKKERKKAKQVKDHKQLQQGAAQPLLGTTQTGKASTIMGQKSPSSYNPPNFPNVPGMGGLPMFPFYPFPARPGLIPSHNLFSQLPNLQNNALFMPQLMGFRPLNPPMRCSMKDEKELTPPLFQPGEGNYSKVAPLVPDTMRLDLSPSGLTPTSSPGVSGSKHKTCSISSTTSTKMRNSPPGQSFTSEPSTTASIAGKPLNYGDFRKKVDDHNSSTVVSSSSGSNINMLKNFEGTIEVSSDDSVHDEMSNKLPQQRTLMPSSVVSSTSGIHRQSHPSVEYPINDNVNIVEDSDNSTPGRRSKEHKKLRKLGKQGKKHSTLNASTEFKNPRLESGVTCGFDENPSSVHMDASSESDKKNNESANSSGHTTFDYGTSPERRKDHKKMKKLLKESKLKKKKDKKDKNKDRSEKLIKSEKSEKRKEEKKDKDKLKKLKKEKKKEKLRTDMEVTSVKYTSSGEGTGSATEVSSVVPKLTLKLGQSSQSPTPLDATESRKTGLKSALTFVSGIGAGKPGCPAICPGREQSPELARISPLVTRPPKQKCGLDDSLSSSSSGNPCTTTGTPSGTGQTSSTSHQTPSLSASLNILQDSVIDIDSNSGGPTTSTLPASATILGLGMNSASNTLPISSAVDATSTNTVTAPSAVPSGTTQQNQHQTAHQHVTSSKHSSAVPIISEANRPSSYIDAEGNRVWICPACGKVDDGSAMIGCDGCDAWYHWVCVGIFVAPNDNEDWYCRVCIAKKRGLHGGDRKRKRNKKKSIIS